MPFEEMVQAMRANSEAFAAYLKRLSKGEMVLILSRVASEHPEVYYSYMTKKRIDYLNWNPPKKKT
jgi:hypothetical protein